MPYLIIIIPFLNVDAMALFPFILIKHQKDKTNQVLITHEKIHLRQQVELLIIPFYFFYLLNYLVNLAWFRNHSKAYMNIVFELEAYRHERDDSYLPKRRLWAWLKYL